MCAELVTNLLTGRLTLVDGYRRGRGIDRCIIYIHTEQVDGYRRGRGIDRCIIYIHTEQVDSYVGIEWSDRQTDRHIDILWG